MKIEKVSLKDIGPETINPLHAAVKKTCPGLQGDVLWEKIREKFQLGHSGDGQAYIDNLNIAIGIWNNIPKPVNCSSIAAAYGV